MAGRSKGSKANSGVKRGGHRPRWEVIEAGFELSAPGLAECPPGDLAEIAVAGRSNVGKSSLLNAFTRHTGLARVSRTPGRTRLLNFFRLRLRGPANSSVTLRWVDLPGYGFAKAHREVREAFGPMIEGYLRGREPLRGLLVLVDARHGPRDSDLDLLEFCAAVELPCLVCVTKCDKLGASERGLLPRRFGEMLGIDPRDVLLTSASSGAGLTMVERRGGLGSELARLARDWPGAEQRSQGGSGGSEASEAAGQGGADADTDTDTDDDARDP
ncbi:ribosome biogenesis GTP-binding protein YsxC [Pseudenhygromyxa sp. WMMC2535]|uniref:ribosome biogenesis GTP-binding protein YihA/YsxC n=1 Tax=Pseudenhygromyxa sp. WMMC2535 TaxID=2712867 RepID=UPI0015575DCC|nr:ribosome biogenesis GTP-binding protein YihA/YsxC [Pseudenhygromyxa sp. WMMC2535]NVB42098.1 ribosome biogenesis GTP-binding protein YsxC [Pseudenhygromyxa sp. WMMC2535]